jgi:hypothetical protein
MYLLSPFTSFLPPSPKHNTIFLVFLKGSRTFGLTLSDYGVGFIHGMCHINNEGDIMLRIALCLVLAFLTTACTHRGPSGNTDEVVTNDRDAVIALAFERATTLCRSATFGVQSRHEIKQPALTRKEINEFVTANLAPRLLYLNDRVSPIIRAYTNDAQAVINDPVVSKEEVTELLRFLNETCVNYLRNEILEVKLPVIA